MILILSDFSSNSSRFTGILFTEDVESERNQFLKYNPTGKIDKIIYGGTKEDVDRIWKRFSQYRHQDSFWFYSNNEIDSFFRINYNIEKIWSELYHRPYPFGKVLELKAKLSNIVDSLFSSLWKTKEEKAMHIDKYDTLLDTVVKEKRFKRESDVSGWILCTYGETTWKEVEADLSSKKQKRAGREKEIKAFQEKFKVTKENKIKFLFDNSTVDEVLLDSLEDKKYKHYYQILGLSGIKGAGYNESSIRKEIQDGMIDFVNMKKEIQARWKEGEVVERREIKNFLRKIYSSYGYKKIAKATDMSRWYELKDISGSKKVGKGYLRVRKFKLVKKK